MYVQVEITLTVAATAVHQEAMRRAAFSKTNDKNSVQIFVPEDSKEQVVAVFTIEKARQIDVVDNIWKAFRFVEDYADCTIRFPKQAPDWYQPIPKLEFTAKQGQYLAFIYYYSKVNGRSPAESDMQRYFKVTPPTVHDMVLTLEQKGFISRVPHQPRSIKLLVSRAEIPDLT
jgi:DNA-binding MarR family transcriptional regulator